MSTTSTDRALLSEPSSSGLDLLFDRLQNNSAKKACKTPQEKKEKVLESKRYLKKRGTDMQKQLIKQCGELLAIPGFEDMDNRPRLRALVRQVALLLATEESEEADVIELEKELAVLTARRRSLTEQAAAQGQDDEANNDQ